MSGSSLSRRRFLATSAAGAGVVAATGLSPTDAATSIPQLNDSLVLPTGWQTLNPGFWQVSNGVLRRRLTNVGDRARSTGFPFHSATKGVQFETEYDPSLPAGIVYRDDWKLTGKFSVKATFTWRADRPQPAEGDDPSWKMYQDGYGQMGIVIGSKCLHESYTKARTPIHIVWSDNETLTIGVSGLRKRQKNFKNLGATAKTSLNLKPGDKVEISVDVSGANAGKVQLTAVLKTSQAENRVKLEVPSWIVSGYVGVISRGLIDFEVNSFEVEPGNNKPLNTPKFDCYACYPLGDSLKLVDGKWQCRFVGLFASDGESAEVRVSDSPNPSGGWENVAVAGRARIVNNEWRRNTSTVHVTLPISPAEKTLYYTVWKDGVDVTPDTRIGTDACGPGTGFVGDVPSAGTYVGRLPQLTAPYKLCGLSCHAITSGLQQKTDDGWKITGGADDWQFRDQPSTGSYKHLEDYNFQVMVWEDDVWYMELVLYPPSTDDAYRVVTNSICGPTSRWQLMRHWNVINPGDHDYGMDDIKGPEQLAIRRLKGLGQDTDYLRRNFQIVHHLVTGDEEVDPLANPKKWRAWKMPNRDFTFVILDSRLVAKQPGHRYLGRRGLGRIQEHLRPYRPDSQSPGRRTIRVAAGSGADRQQSPDLPDGH